MAALWLHPLGEFPASMADTVDAREQLEELRLLRRPMPEVAVDRVGDGVDVLDQDVLELGQALATFGEARIRMAAIRLTLQGEDALRVVLDEFESPELCGLGHGSLLVGRILARCWGSGKGRALAGIRLG